MTELSKETYSKNKVKITLSNKMLYDFFKDNSKEWWNQSIIAHRFKVSESEAQKRISDLHKKHYIYASKGNNSTNYKFDSRTKFTGFTPISHPKALRYAIKKICPMFYDSVSELTEEILKKQEYGI